MGAPLLSVCLITYNHARFIHQAIDSVLNQRTNFEWELIIADDCSTDGTQAIIAEYKKIHPQQVRLIQQKTNVGPGKNWLDLLTSSEAKYIAYLEGDDYWIGTDKLQKQVDCLEQNESCSLVFHDAILELGEEKYIFSDYYKKTEFTSGRTDFGTVDVLNNWFIPSSSMVFRNTIPKQELRSFMQDVESGDIALQLLLSARGSIKLLNEKWSAYRKHDDGIAHRFNNPDWFILNMLYLLKKFDLYSGGVYRQSILGSIEQWFKKSYGSTMLNGINNSEKVANFISIADMCRGIWIKIKRKIKI